ncbi:MAG: hypothetical protein K0U36_02850 [Alphaproteobacteria bacterium]|nr:hypothetical protein [Alphaproteobacteria bacterium]
MFRLALARPRADRPASSVAWLTTLLPLMACGGTAATTGDDASANATVTVLDTTVTVTKHTTTIEYVTVTVGDPDAPNRAPVANPTPHTITLVEGSTDHLDISLSPHDLATDPDGDGLSFTGRSSFSNFIIGGREYEIGDDIDVITVFVPPGITAPLDLQHTHLDVLAPTSFSVGIYDGHDTTAVTIHVEFVHHAPRVSIDEGGLDTTFTEDDAGDFYLLDLSLFHFADEQDTAIGVADLTASTNIGTWQLTWEQTDPDDDTTRTHLRVTDSEEVSSGDLHFTLTDSDGYDTTTNSLYLLNE